MDKEIKKQFTQTMLSIFAWILVGYLLAGGLGLAAIYAQKSANPDPSVGTYSSKPYKLQIDESADPTSTEETYLRDVVSQVKHHVYDHMLNLTENLRADVCMWWVNASNSAAGLGPNGLPIEEEKDTSWMVNENIADPEYVDNRFDGDYNDYDMGDVLLVELREYTIQDGDNWWKIAEREYGAGARSYALARFNRMTIETPLKRGMVIAIPVPNDLNLLRHSYYDKEG